MNAVDTNVLFYAKDFRETIKQPIAENLIQTLPDGILIWQVATEYIAATRKLEPFGYSRQKAFADLRFFRSAWKTILPSWNVFDRAEDLMNRLPSFVLGRTDRRGVFGKQYSQTLHRRHRR